MQPCEGIKTGIGRARAFLRLALMQKKLPDYLDLLQSSDQSFRATFWEDWSLIRNDEAPEIFGHMQGLSIGTVLNAFYLISQSRIHPESPGWRPVGPNWSEIFKICLTLDRSQTFKV